MNLALDKLRNWKLEHPIPESPDTPLKKSAVTIPLYETGKGLGVILQQRNRDLKSHPGQISFPGGTMDEQEESLLHVALREWEEEMGVPRDHLEVLSPFHPVITGTGYHITPFVCLYHGDFRFQTNPDEVESVIQLDLSQLNSLPFYAIEASFRSEKHTIFYYDLPEGLLWGATARMLVHLLEEVFGYIRKPEMRSPNLSGPPFFRP